jgi:hypothetical protein
MTDVLTTIVLWLFVINLGTSFGAGVFESRIVVPQWFITTPDGGIRWNAEAARHADVGLRFWVYVTTVPLTLLTIASLIMLWWAPPPIRGWWARRRRRGRGRSRDDVQLFHSDHAGADAKLPGQRRGTHHTSAAMGKAWHHPSRRDRGGVANVAEGTVAARFLGPALVDDVMHAVKAISAPCCRQPGPWRAHGLNPKSMSHES